MDIIQEIAETKAEIAATESKIDHIQSLLNSKFDSWNDIDKEDFGTKDGQKDKDLLLAEQNMFADFLKMFANELNQLRRKEELLIMKNLKADDGRSTFHNALQSLQAAEIKKLNGVNCLCFNKFRYIGQFFDKIIIRKCWEPLFNSLCKLPRGTILGTPGIGKSIFLLYLAYRFIKKGDKVVFFHFSAPGSAVIATQTEVLTRSPTLDEYESAVFLFDSVKPPDCRRGYLVSSARNDACYNEFKKTHKGRFHYMPIWEADEVEDYINTYLPNSTEADRAYFHERYRTYGGVPRTIFDEEIQENISLDEEVKKVISSCTISETVFAISKLQDSPDNFHKLVHMRVTNENFDGFEYAIASVELADRFIKEATLGNMVNLGKAIQFARQNGVSVLGGDLFEPFVIHKIKAGGDFKLKCIKGPNEGTYTTMKFKKTDMQLRNEINEDMGSKMGLYIPKKSNFTAMDLTIDGFMLNVTINYDHGFKINAESAKVIERLRHEKGNNLAIIFVVPGDNFFETFKAQKIVKIDPPLVKTSHTDDELLKRDIFAFAENLPQYAMAMPGC